MLRGFYSDNEKVWRDGGLIMRKFKVTGMSCAACQSRVEKAVGRVDGVTACSVSLLTNTMGVEGTATDRSIIEAVKKAGYGAEVLDGTGQLPDTEADMRKMKVRLVSSVVLLLILMYFSMGHMMLSFPIPGFLHDPVNMGILQLIITIAVLAVNSKFFVNGVRGILNLSPNMDTLIALGSGAAFVYSAAVLISGGRGDYYFESSAMIVTLVTVGKTLEQYSRGRTTDAISSLMKLSPSVCTVIREGREVSIRTEELVTGDIVIVRPGESFPCDGTVTEGSTSSDESLITGESVPVDKEEGDTVISAAINLTGLVKIKATGTGSDSTLSKIVSMVSEAASTKAPIARLADRISAVFVPAVMGIALVTFAVWMILGKDTGFCLARAISVLVVSCPCALGLATPVAVMVGSGLGAKNGILFKTAGSLQETGKVKIAALDQTGTVTAGVMTVTGIVPAEGVSREYFLKAAATAERGSEHPIGKAIASASDTYLELKDFRSHAGAGVTATVDGHEVKGGRSSFVSSSCSIPEPDGAGKIFFAMDGDYLGYIRVEDAIKPDSSEAVRQLRGMGIYTVMLTGDGEEAALRTASEAGIDKAVWRITPGGKASAVRQLKEYGKCAMTGDGINDAPALTEADSGIAIGAGTDVAIDSADVVLMSGSLTDLAAAIRLSRKTYSVILQNLFWALFYNVLLIPAACGAYIPLGITMTPALGAAAMSLSSICVVLNALRLNLTDIKDPARDRRRSSMITDVTIDITEEKNMTKTMKISGMMCGHCEARVKKAIEACDGVISASVSHETGEAVVTLGREIDSQVLKDAVEAQDYEVVSIT